MEMFFLRVGAQQFLFRFNLCSSLEKKNVKKKILEFLQNYKKEFTYAGRLFSFKQIIWDKKYYYILKNVF